MQMKKILLINDYSTCDHFYGGRSNFILELYKKNGGIFFTEASFQKEIPDTNGKFVRSNVNYVNFKNARELKEIVRDFDVIYLHTWKAPIWKIKGITGKIILQQHNQLSFYNKKVFESVDEMICYTDADCDIFGKYVKTRQFYMGSDVMPASPRDGGDILYSGGADIKSIKKIIQIAKSCDKAVIVDAIRGRFDYIRKRVCGVNVTVRSSEKKEDIYKGASCFIQLSNKGYSLSAIEALSQGVPSFLLNNSASYKHLVVDDYFLCDSVKEMKEKIASFVLTKDISKRCIDKYKKDFWKSNEKIYKYLTKK